MAGIIFGFLFGVFVLVMVVLMVIGSIFAIFRAFIDYVLGGDADTKPSSKKKWWQD